MASGKGGTGKTTVASSLAFYLSLKGLRVFAADADVDAPDLLLALGGGRTVVSMDVEASNKAIVDSERCISCGKCVEVCPFGAMVLPVGGNAVVAELMCEGCGVCTLVCPTKAVEIKKAKTGVINVVETKHGFLCVTGRLKFGEHNSGHLVASVRNLARRKAQDAGSDVIIVDAAPGIGCPVIASITGADYVIAVTEPTPAAKRNLERLSRIVNHFGISAGVVINKSGLSVGIEESIKDWALNEIGFHFLGEIPVDYEVVKALVQMKPVIEFNPSARASKSLIKITEHLVDLL